MLLFFFSFVLGLIVEKPNVQVNLTDYILISSSSFFSLAAAFPLLLSLFFSSISRH